MATEIITSFLQIADSNGVPYSGALVYVYDVGTTTSKSVWTDTALSVAGANPIVCDSSGRHDMRYIASGSYKIVVKTAAGVTIYTRDNIDGRIPVGTGSTATLLSVAGEATVATLRTSIGAAAATEMSTAQTDISTLQTRLGSTGATTLAAGTTAQRPAGQTVGRVRYNSTTARYEGDNGTNWATFPREGELSLVTALAASGGAACLQRSRTVATAAQTVTSTIPADATIPQIGEGTALTTLNAISFTPRSASSTIRVEVLVSLTGASGEYACAALFLNSAANAVAANILNPNIGGAVTYAGQIHIVYEHAPGVLTAQTYDVRAGSSAGASIYINSSSGGITLGATKQSEVLITEWLSP